MKEQYVSGLSEGERVDSAFILRVKELRAARTGEPYLHMELGDRTGRIPAVKFRPDPSADSIPAGSVVRVRGRVTSYRGVRRVSVEQLRPAESFDRHDMLPGPRRDREEAVEWLHRAFASVRDSQLRAVLTAVFGDEWFLGRFLECPASQTHHHAYLGGLAEHTLAVVRLCDRLAAVYGQVDRDMLTAAALLHDVGKVDELAFETSIEYTDEGRLLGHVLLGDHRVRQAMSNAGASLSLERSTALFHALLSHHGELEWGAPKRPSTLEALLLHHADNLDAKAAGFIQLTENASAAEERWTDVTNLFRRPLYVPAPLDADRWRAPEEDDQYLVRTA